MRNYGPVVAQQTLTTRPVALPRHNAPSDASSTDRTSQSFIGGN